MSDAPSQIQSHQSQPPNRRKRKIQTTIKTICGHPYASVVPTTKALCDSVVNPNSRSEPEISRNYFMTDNIADYVTANGVRMFYEIRGEGDPLVLMHGGTASNEGVAALADVLARRYRVIMPERRAHGRTHDVEGPITYDNMTDDMLAFLDALHIGPAIIAGHSDGANIGMLMAIRTPERVRALIPIGGNHRADGLEQSFIDWMRTATPESFAAAAPGEMDAYTRLSPDDAAQFAVVFEKIRRMWLEEPSLTTADLGAIAAPVLVIAGDGDLIRWEHLREFQRSVQNGQIAIVPGASHDVINEKPELVGQLIHEFATALSDRA